LHGFAAQASTGDWQSSRDGGGPGRGGLPDVGHGRGASREACIPLEYLSGFNGHLQTDAYEGYGAVGTLLDIIQDGC